MEGIRKNITVKPFLDENFLLENRTAEILYYDYASKLPIIDYHNHLPPEQIAGNKKFANITEAWLKGDHYKWRAMRTFGIAEEFITGKQPDFSKFKKWAETVPYTIRNPLFHWTHLELKRYFDIDDLLNPESAEKIYNKTEELLQKEKYSTRGLLRKMKVETICTTDDPVDDLRFHRQYAAEGASPQMFPTFRPDQAILIEREGFADYIQQLEIAADTSIESFDDLSEALKKRAVFFAENGCKLADHGLEQAYADDFSENSVNNIFKRRMSGQHITPSEAREFMSALLYRLGILYAEMGWVQQFHLGALRNTNSRLLGTLGPDTGFDSIGDRKQAAALARFLNRLDTEGKLAKTILYNLNPADNEIFAAMIGNFNDGSVRGKMQYGSAWWFLDQKDGMEKQINALSNMGLLSCFIGMLTDSRSFLSFPRHEYFRRILCNLIGRDVHNGELPADTNWLGSIVEKICYRNAREYFGFRIK